MSIGTASPSGKKRYAPLLSECGGFRTPYLKKKTIKCYDFIKASSLATYLAKSKCTGTVVVPVFRALSNPSLLKDAVTRAFCK